MRRLGLSCLLFLLLFAACGVFCPNDETRLAISGRYVLAVSQPMCANEPAISLASDPEQHSLTLSADRKTVQETFVRAGKTYVIEYDTVSIKPTTLTF